MKELNIRSMVMRWITYSGGQPDSLSRMNRDCITAGQLAHSRYPDQAHASNQVTQLRPACDWAAALQYLHILHTREQGTEATH